MEHEKHHKPEQQAQLGAWSHLLELGRKVFRGSLELPESQDGKFAHAGLEQVSVHGPGPFHVPGIAAVLTNWKKLNITLSSIKAFPSLALDLLEYLLLFLVENLFLQQCLAEKQALLQGKVICQAHPWDNWKIWGAGHRETPEFLQISCQEAGWKHLAALYQPFPHT